MKQQSQVISGDIRSKIVWAVRLAEEEKKSERDEFWVFCERQKDVTLA
jgi:hypothetical protein